MGRNDGEVRRGKSKQWVLRSILLTSKGVSIGIDDLIFHENEIHIFIGNLEKEE